MMKKLHHHTISSFSHIRDWLKALDTINSNLIPKQLLHKAATLRDKKLASIESPTLLHGDLHLDNILQDGEEWLAIDPKGVIGYQNLNWQLLLLQT